MNDPLPYQDQAIVQIFGFRAPVAALSPLQRPANSAGVVQLNALWGHVPL